MKFPTSPHAHRWLDPLVARGWTGAEIGASAHNPFDFPTVNVDYTDEMTVFKKSEIDLCGEYREVDVVARADKLPFKDSELGFIISSHMLEHVASPIRAHLEWHRVLRYGGIVYTLIPQRDAHPPDRDRPISQFDEILESFENNWDEETHPIRNGVECSGGHYFVWDIPLYLQMIAWLNHRCQYVYHECNMFDVVDVREKDDKVGNSLVFVLRVV